MKSRFIIVFCGFVALFLVLATRAFTIQVLPHEPLARMQKRQYNTVVALPPQRGKITDRRGEELATTLPAFSLYADPTKIKKPILASRLLAVRLGMNAKELKARLTSDRRFAWVKRGLARELMEDIQSLKIEGLGFVQEGVRALPNQVLGAQILGTVGTDGQGLEGLEKQYDIDLKGERRAVNSKRDARGRPLVVNGQLFEENGDGNSIETTLDKDLQYELERELEDVTLKQQAAGALGVILDPNTGEILAMASYPFFDPEKRSAAQLEGRRNRVVTDVFEPGSTFKAVTISAALRTGIIKPNTKFFCENGKFKLGKRTIHESEGHHQWGWLTVSEILSHSSNVGTSKIALDIGQDKIKEMMKSYGIGSRTEIDFPGESAGLVNWEKWPEHLLANISFGHGVGVTALQMANTYSTIANGGKLMRPYLVKRIIDSDGRTIEHTEPHQVRQVLSDAEAASLRLMLSGATSDDGTGRAARVEGYPVAGKTGTAQKVDPHGRGYMKGAYLSSFAGFVPANNPQFTIYVMIDHPKKEYYGAQVAAPVFQRLATFALRRRGSMPVVIGDLTRPQTNLNQVAQATHVPESKRIESEKAKPGIISALEENQVPTTPDFRGLTVREVAELISETSEQKLDAKIIGSGVAFNQTPAPGVPIGAGKQVRIYFKPEAP